MKKKRKPSIIKKNRIEFYCFIRISNCTREKFFLEIRIKSKINIDFAFFISHHISVQFHNIRNKYSIFKMAIKNNKRREKNKKKGYFCILI